MEESKLSIVHSSTYENDRGEDWGIEIENYGYRVYDKHKLARIEDEELYLGSFKVEAYDFKELEGKIPVLYCVRNWDSELGYNRFVCGLDLTKDGKVWVGIGKDSIFDTIEEAIKFVEDKEGVICKIFLEEAMSY